MEMGFRSWVGVHSTVRAAAGTVAAYADPPAKPPHVTAPTPTRGPLLGPLPADTYERNSVCPNDRHEFTHVGAVPGTVLPADVAPRQVLDQVSRRAGQLPYFDSRAS